MNSSDLENAILDLQTRAAFQEDSISQLDSIVQKQYRLIDELTLKIHNLENRLEAMKEELATRDNIHPDQKPPHY